MLHQYHDKMIKYYEDKETEAKEYSFRDKILKLKKLLPIYEKEKIKAKLQK